MRQVGREVGDELPGVSDLFALALRQGRQLAADYVLLAVLDARSAAVKLALLLSAGLAAAVLAVTAWLAFVVAASVWLLGTGASWPLALVAAAGVNVVAAGILTWWVRRPVSELPFAAILRQLRGDPPPAPEEQR